MNSNSSELSIGEIAPYFSLPATDGKIYSLSDFNNRKALLVVFTCNHCPYAQAYEARLCHLAESYQSKGMSFLAICANDSSGYPEDDFEHMVEKSKTLGFPFPYLHDQNQVVAKAYHALCTPEAFLFDSKLRLQYHGRIDDNYRDEKQVKSPDLQNAIEAVLAEKTPKIQKTSALGCTIKWKI